MKKISSLFLISVFVLYFGTTEILAQKKPPSKEMIIFEFLIPSRKSSNKMEVAVNENSKGKIFGQTSIEECLSDNCEGNYSTYTVEAKAFRTGKNTTKINFKIKVTDSCKTQGVFVVYRNHRTKTKLSCGVSLIAYYLNRQRRIKINLPL